MFNILLDMDGVLVDNNLFESAVTNEIVKRLSIELSISETEARQSWEGQLRRDASSPRWYDYDYHCRQLGLPPLALPLHRDNAPLLKSIPGADKTVQLLLEQPQKFQVWIASDATAWVVRFKLESIGLPLPESSIISSDITHCSKNSKEYWRQIRAFGIEAESLVYIDNRLDNLRQCLQIAGDARAIHYEFDEHVSNLTHGPLAIPDGSLTDHVEQGAIFSVSGHDELQDLLLNLASRT